MKKFPLNGIIGIVGNSAGELQQAIEQNLTCVEIRADLLLNSGLSWQQVLEVITAARVAGLGVLITLRRHDHGGVWSGSEQQRFDYCCDGVTAGADIVDVEWDSECAADLIARNIPTILSNHDFHGMLSDEALQSVTGQMLALNPAALKMVPTARTIADGFRMLNWVADQRDGPRRIGFAMGAAGAFSRLLTLAFDGAVTYATFGQPVAPGQFSVDEMRTLYSVENISRQTPLVGLVGDSEVTRRWADQLKRHAENGAVGIPLELDNNDAITLASCSLTLDFVAIQSNRGSQFNVDTNGEDCVLEVNQSTLISSEAARLLQQILI